MSSLETTIEVTGYIHEPNILIPHDFGSEEVNPRFRAWLRATNKQVGDTFKNHDYTLWISKKSQEFKGLNNLALNLPIGCIENGHESFTQFLLNTNE